MDSKMKRVAKVTPFQMENFAFHRTAFSVSPVDGFLSTCCYQQENL